MPLSLVSPWEGRYQVLANNNLQIREVTKADEGVYRCEASVEARGEIDFVDIAVVVNGELATVANQGAGVEETSLNFGSVFNMCNSREQWFDFMARRLMSSF